MRGEDKWVPGSSPNSQPSLLGEVPGQCETLPEIKRWAMSEAYYPTLSYDPHTHAPPLAHLYLRQQKLEWSKSVSGTSRSRQGRLGGKAGNGEVPGHAGLCSYPWLPVLALDVAAGCWPWAATVPSLDGRQLSVIELISFCRQSRAFCSICQVQITKTDRQPRVQKAGVPCFCRCHHPSCP